jgi:hypothetical protein
VFGACAVRVNLHSNPRIEAEEGGCMVTTIVPLDLRVGGMVEDGLGKTAVGVQPFLHHVSNLRDLAYSTDLGPAHNNIHP